MGARRSRVPVVLGVGMASVVLATVLLVAGVAADRRLLARVDELRASPAGAPPLGEPTSWDGALDDLAAAAAMSAEDETAFYARFRDPRVTLPALAGVAGRYGKALDVLHGRFPASLLRPDGPLAGGGPLLGREHDPAALAETARRVLLLARLEALLGRPRAVDGLLSCMALGLVAGRGSRGEIRFVSAEMTNTILFSICEQLVELLKRGALPVDDLPRMARTMAAVEGLALDEGGALAAECLHQARTLDPVREGAGLLWWLPRLALIGDPAGQLREFGREGETCLRQELPREGLASLARLRRGLGEQHRMSSVTVLLAPDVGDRCGALIRGRALLRATRVMLAAFRFRARRGVFPRDLGELERDGEGEVLPVDPITGKPFVYERSGAVFVLRSPDLDGRDDGGDPSRDLVFTAPETMTAGRRAPNGTGRRP